MNARYVGLILMVIVVLCGVFASRSVIMTDRGADHIYIGADIVDFLAEQIAVGKINNDVYDDVVTGTFWSKEPLAPPACSYCEYRGAVQVFYGGDPIESQQTVDLRYPTPGVPDVAILGIKPGDIMINVGVGRVDEDARSDIIIGATEDHVSEGVVIQKDEGEVYVILGSGSLPDTIDLAVQADFNTYVRYYIMGKDTLDNFGYAITSADINDDQYDEIIIAAPRGDGRNGTVAGSGEVYIFFPKPVYGMPDTVNLADGSATHANYSAIIYGAAADDGLGFTRGFIPYGMHGVPPALATGDWNGDDVPDLLVGAGNARNVDPLNPGPEDQGALYAIFGGAAITPGDTIWCDRNAGAAGAPDMAIFGMRAGDLLGTGFELADVNNDTYDDLIVGAPLAENDVSPTEDAGEAYIIFGASNLTTQRIRDLSDNPGSFSGVDIVMFGEEQDNHFGQYISGGDFDGDDYDEIGITARLAAPLGSGLAQVGETSIIFGKTTSQWTAWPMIRLKTDWDDLKIIKLASSTDDAEMATVRFGGDLNNDLKADVVFGAYDADRSDGLGALAGEMYVMKGNDTWKSGTITASEPWRGSVFVNADLTVAAGATVTIEAGTDVFVWPKDLGNSGVDATRVEFTVNGFLQVNGTPANPVRFLAWDADSLQSEDAAGWWGISVPAGSDAEFNHTVVRNAIRGIQTNAGITMKNCTIEQCDYIGVSIANVAASDTVKIEDTTINGAGVYGINLLGGSRLHVKNSLVKNYLYGVTVYSGAKLYAENTEFSENYFGVQIHPGPSPVPPATAELVFCDIKDNVDSGIWVNNISGVTVKSCLISGNDYFGVNLEYANIELRTNNIKNSDIGISCWEAAPQIRRGNIIKLNEDGINLLGSLSTAVVESTTIQLNDVGVEADGFANPDLGHATGGSSTGYNVIQFNTTHAVENWTSPPFTMKAEKNWWGAPPTSSMFLGDVDRSPYLKFIPENGPYPYEDPGEAPAFQPADDVPMVHDISNGYPNPFNPTTTLDYEVPRSGHVLIAVFNTGGQRVATLADEHKTPGSYKATWDGRSDDGTEVATGVYFVQMRASSFVKTRKLVFLK